MNACVDVSSLRRLSFRLSLLLLLLRLLRLFLLALLPTAILAQGVQFRRQAAKFAGFPLTAIATMVAAGTTHDGGLKRVVWMYQQDTGCGTGWFEMSPEHTAQLEYAYTSDQETCTIKANDEWEAVCIFETMSQTSTTTNFTRKIRRVAVLLE